MTNSLEKESKTIVKRSPRIMFRKNRLQLLENLGKVTKNEKKSIEKKFWRTEEGLL